MTDEIQPTDMYIPAPPEMVEAMLSQKGHRKDVDKEVTQMNEEGTILSLYKFICRKGSV